MKTFLEGKLMLYSGQLLFDEMTKRQDLYFPTLVHPTFLPSPTSNYSERHLAI